MNRRANGREHGRKKSDDKEKEESDPGPVSCLHEVGVDSGAEGVVCSNFGRGATIPTQMWKLPSLDHFHRRVGRNSGFEGDRTSGQWSKTTRMEDIAG